MAVCLSLGSAMPILGLLAFSSVLAEPCQDSECATLSDQPTGGLSLMQSGRSVLPVTFQEGSINLGDSLVDEFASMEDEFDDGYAQAYASSQMKSAANKQSPRSAALANHFSSPHAYMNTCWYAGVLVETLLVIAGFALADRVFKWARRSAAACETPGAHELAKTVGGAEPAPIFALGGSEGFAALEEAVRAGDETRCLELLKQGGPRAVRQEDPYGCTALHVAAHCGSVTMTKLLLSNGAKVDAREAWDETALHIAARSGSTEVCALLLAHGADINAANASDWTPLLVAGLAEKEAVCELLLEQGAGAGGVADSEVPQLVNAVIVRRIFKGGPTPPASKVQEDAAAKGSDADGTEPWPDSDQ